MRKRTNLKSSLVIFFLVFINISCFGVAAEKNETDKIFYIKVKLIEGKPSEINYEILEGKIKTPKVQSFNPNDIYYELISNEETLIYEGSVPDPSIQKYEYTGDNGEIKSVEVKQDTSEVVVRTNYNGKISKINLFKIPTGGSLKKSKDEFIPLGSFKIIIK